jgi:hypothetical protein
MLDSRIGGGSGVGFRPFVVHPPSCRGGRFHTTDSGFVMQKGIPIAIVRQKKL